MTSLPTARSEPRCDVDSVDGMLGSEEFLQDYLKPGRPVLMRGAARGWPA
jgi:hypothetical protein